MKFLRASQVGRFKLLSFKLMGKTVQETKRQTNIKTNRHSHLLPMPKLSEYCSSLLDSFTGPPILSGSGNSSARVFLDGRHTRVGLALPLSFLLLYSSSQ